MNRLSILILLIFALCSMCARAGIITSDTTMSIKWAFTSAGSSCGGYPAKEADLYYTNGPHIAIYKAPDVSTPQYADSSSLNNDQTGYQGLLTAGTDLSYIYVATGFVDGQPTSCPGNMAGQYCYKDASGSSTAQSINFDPSPGMCDQWVLTNYTNCAFNNTRVWVKFTPVGGCPSPLNFDSIQPTLGVVATGSTTKPISVSITNSGSSDLSACAISVSDSATFQLTNPLDCDSIAKNKTCTINLAGTPAAAQTYTDQITIKCTDGSGTKQTGKSGTFSVTGKSVSICTWPSVDDGSGKCVFNYTSKNACDDSSGGGPVSGVAAGNKSVTTATMFQSLLNKKLACCLNKETVGGTVVAKPKFDCVENIKTASTDFNILWASNDDMASEGGQLNALILAVGTKPQTGFYTLNGSRCDEFSEFSGALHPMSVDPLIPSSQQYSVGKAPTIRGAPDHPIPAFPLPTGQAYLNLQNKIGKRVPATQAEMYRCPILVRAAIVVACPEITPTAPVGKNYFDSYLASNGKVYCPVASTVSVQTRIEQLYQITGLPLLETLQGTGLTSNISVSDLIRQKYGTQ